MGNLVYIPCDASNTHISAISDPDESREIVAIPHVDQFSIQRRIQMKVSLDRNVNIKKLSGVNKYSLVHIPISNKHVYITDKSISLYLINARSEAGKAVSICEHIIDKSVDILAITETCCVKEMVYI